MAIAQRLREFLQRKCVEYTHTQHPRACTARDVASAEHLPSREVAKTVIVLGDGGYHMIVVPANKLVDFQEMRLVLRLQEARLATEQELENLFPDCELGAMPAMGNVYDMPVYLDSSLAGENVIAFNGGTHTDFVHMQIDEFHRMVRPTVISLARKMKTMHAASAPLY
jgi:Ala-tRNA(Pro) deacylase